MKKIISRIMVVALVMSLSYGIFIVKTKAGTKGYKFTYKKATVYMGGAAKNFIKKAGKPKKKKACKSCAYNGKDRTYKYADFILYTYSNSDKGAEYVNGITFLTKNVSTKEGIHIGSSFDDVKKAYGKGKDNFGVYTYKSVYHRQTIQIHLA